MDDISEAELGRYDDDDWNKRESRRGDPDDGGARTIVLVTYTETTYPTAPQSYYAVKRGAVFGAEVEGGPGSVTVRGSGFFAFNLGNALPPSGTSVLATFSENRWVFRYD